MQLLNPRAIKPGIAGQFIGVGDDGRTTWVDPTADGGGSVLVLVPLTTTLDGDPQLVWDADDQLVMTEVPL